MAPIFEDARGRVKDWSIDENPELVHAQIQQHSKPLEASARGVSGRRCFNRIILESIGDVFIPLEDLVVKVPNFIASNVSSSLGTKTGVPYLRADAIV